MSLSKRSGKVRGKGRFQIETAFIERVVKCKSRRMEELAVEAEVSRNPVHGVARHGKVDRRQMYANLMRPPGFETNAKQRMGGQKFLDEKMRNCFPRS